MQNSFSIHNHFSTFVIFLVPSFLGDKLFTLIDFSQDIFRFSLHARMATVFKFLFWPLSFSVFGFRREVNILEHKKGRKLFLASTTNSSLFAMLPLLSFLGNRKLTLLSCISACRTFSCFRLTQCQQILSSFVCAFISEYIYHLVQTLNVVAFGNSFCW